MNKYINRILSILLAVVMLVSAGEAVQAAEEVKNSESNNNSNGDVFNEAEFIASAVRTELIEEKRTVNSDTYLLSSGQYECVVYSDNKYYVDDAGSYKEIDNAIVRVGSDKGVKQSAATQRVLKNYAYTNAANDVKTYFTHGTTPSVLLDYKENAIEFAPISSQKSYLVIAEKTASNTLDKLSKATSNTATYKDVYKDTDFTYVVTNSAVKEYITLKSKEAPTEFQFAFNLNGLKLEERKDGTIAFKAGDETVFELGTLFAMDAKEAYTTELEYTIVKNSGNTAIIDISLSEKYAKDPARAYPIVIDPTIMVSGANNTYDTHICSSYPDNGYYLSTYLKTGRDSTYGICRTYIKFDIPQSVPSGSITNAYIALEKYSGDAPQVEACRVTSAWQSSSLTWNTQATFVSSDTSGVATNYSGNWYKMDVTSMAQAWRSGAYSNYGVVIRDKRETYTLYRSTQFYSSDSVSPHRPELNIVYTQSGGGGGGTSTGGSRVDSLYGDTSPYRAYMQNRANCYAYALHIYRYGEYSASSFKQQLVGEFANDSQTYAQLEEEHISEKNMTVYSANQYADYVEERMKADLLALGTGGGGNEYDYHEVKYTNDITPGCRRIALVATVGNDMCICHFYMRHSNGIWSHKYGGNEVTNLSLGTGTLLNDNNRTADQNYFENLLKEWSHDAIGVRYYDIGKSAIIDYPHGTSDDSSLKTSLISTADKAGDIRTKNISFTKPNTSGHIDYQGDVDWYKITCTPGTYVLTSSAGSGLDIDLDFCNSAGTVLTEEHNTGNVNKTLQLVGTEYYIKVYAKSNGVNTIGSYTLTWQQQ